MNWQRSFYALCVGQWVVMTGFGMAQPFYPLFVQELGISDLSEIAWWSSILASSSAFALTAASPFWGALADRRGRKLMVERSMYGGAIVAVAVGFCRSVHELLVLRICSGLITGTMGATAALTATMSSKERLTRNLALLQTANFAGSSLGPLLGGLVAAHLGFRAVFFSTGAMLAVGGIFVTVLVTEAFTRPRANETAKSGSLLRGIWLVASSPALIAMNVLLLVMQGLMFGIAPIVTLFVQGIAGGENVPTLTGIIFGATAVSSALAAIWVGRHADRWGHRRVLFVCALGTALLSFPQAYADDWVVFLALRVLQGAFIGGVLPVANTLIGRLTAPEHRGAAFGVSSSSISLGSALAPLSFAAVTAGFGLGSTFTFAGIAALLVAVWLSFVNLDDRKAHV